MLFYGVLGGERQAESGESEAKGHHGQPANGGHGGSGEVEGGESEAEGAKTLLKPTKTLLKHS